MEPIKWTEEFSVGVNRFDQQHISIILLINKLIETPRAAVNSELISDTLLTMTQYALNHFKEEEYYLEEFGYKDFENHKKMHHAFLKRTVKLNQKTLLYINDVPTEILKYLKNWWISHILNEDMKYKSLFKDKVLI